MTRHGLLRGLAPPLLVRAARRASGRGLKFTGQPATWAEAVEQSSGYDAAAILSRVLDAARKVERGEAAWERDSVTFDTPQYPFHILAMLLRSAALAGGRLDVVDFGGSLGSTYRQCRPFLGPLAATRWQIVEQPGFVAAGAEFANGELSFHERLSDLPQAIAPRMVLLSSVLQYLEDPQVVVTELARCGATSLMIDRTPLSDAPADRLCVQHVPRRIYEASYPCWIFSHDGLLRSLQQSGWRVLHEYPSPEGRHAVSGLPPFEFRGLMLEAAP